MNKKNDKKLCWNCDGSVGFHLAQCPYCGVDLAVQAEGVVPQAPYSEKIFAKEFSVTDEEWNKTMQEKEMETTLEGEEHPAHASKKETIALFMLLPGIVFLLFGLVLLLFSQEGVLTLHWNQNFAYFYLVGAFPLIYLGWRALK